MDRNPWMAAVLPPPRPEGSTPARRVPGRAASGSGHQEIFDLIAERGLERFRGSRSRSYQALWDALVAARDEMIASGRATDAHAHRALEWVMRDLECVAAVLARGSRPAQALLRELGALDPDGLGNLQAILALSEDVMRRVASQARGPMTRRAGEVTCAGMLCCAECGSQRRLKCTSWVEPCRRCGASAFTRPS